MLMLVQRFFAVCSSCADFILLQLGHHKFYLFQIFPIFLLLSQGSVGHSFSCLLSEETLPWPPGYNWSSELGLRSKDRQSLSWKMKIWEQDGLGFLYTLSYLDIMIFVNRPLNLVYSWFDLWNLLENLMSNLPDLLDLDLMNSLPYLLDI